MKYDQHRMVPPLLKAQALADLLGLSVRTVYRKVSQGELPQPGAYRAGRPAGGSKTSTLPRPLLDAAY